MNKNSVARIGKVTLKKRGNVVHIPAIKRDERLSDFLSHARSLATESAPAGPVVGWFMVAWDSDGGYNHGLFIDPAAGVIGNTVAPSFCADVLRRALIEQGNWQ